MLVSQDCQIWKRLISWLVSALSIWHLKVEGSTPDQELTLQQWLGLHTRWDTPSAQVLLSWCSCWNLARPLWLWTMRFCVIPVLKEFIDPPNIYHIRWQMAPSGSSQSYSVQQGWEPPTRLSRSGKWAVGNEQWAMGTGQWAMGNLQWDWDSNC